jgi:hypothetical protein
LNGEPPGVITNKGRVDGCGRYPLRYYLTLILNFPRNYIYTCYSNIPINNFIAYS